MSDAKKTHTFVRVILICSDMEKIPVIHFFKHKYGGELLVDLNDIHYIRRGIKRNPVHRYSFYCLILVTDGREEIGINGNRITAERGTIVAGIPGDVWCWNVDTRLQGYVLAFEEGFLLSFFNDRLFLQKFSYMQKDRHSPFYRIDGDLYDRVCAVMQQIRAEIHGDETDLRKTSLQKIDQHILRAMLYEILTLFKRAEALAVFDEGAVSVKRYIGPFTAAVEKHFAEQRNIRYYADFLCITPNYLNKIVKQSMGMNVKEYINRRTVQEIKNLLDYTSASVAEIAGQLNFLSPSYLGRYFKVHAGMTPKEYRNRNLTN